MNFGGNQADSEPLDETVNNKERDIPSADMPTTGRSSIDSDSAFSFGAATEKFNGSEIMPTELLRVREAYKIGERIEQRYEILEQLGRGGFGTVFRARDHDLNRIVAIKQSTGLRSFVAGRVRDEAKAVASLNHPGIVSIYDLITISNSELLIVMECLEGQTLASYLQSQPISVMDAVELGIQIVEALKHAHEKKLVHSDLKPGNLFVTNSGLLKLLDFGLAVAYFPDQANSSIGGTLGYMSPEQIRGESHRIDGRADIWAFGVIMYQMFTGTLPFKGSTKSVVIEATLRREVPPFRQLNPKIDSELQRIVLRCLEKRMLDRYSNSAELQDDLRAWVEVSGQAATDSNRVGTVGPLESGSSKSLTITSRGLQPFTEDDSQMYLGLVPGPRDRFGIPDSINFWRSWVESSDLNTDYPVGVLYGPSGSGKTSYVRAGLLPSLSPSVCTVYVECRPGNLALRITRIIESRLKDPTPSGSSLREVLSRFRSDDSSVMRFSKILIVLDQFEAWSHGACVQEREDLAEALRQCDGVRIRALVVIRDDFWMGATELLRWLELPLQEGRNIGSIDLLDSRHAASILQAIGRRIGTLPPEPEALSEEQNRFVDQAIEELATGGAIIAVHLVIFSQMVRFQQWSPKSLSAAGGVVGACSLFFQELFQGAGSSSVSPEYRRIAPVALPVLSALLPIGRSTVSSLSLTRTELSKSVNRAGTEDLFDDALRVLIEDLSLITVVSPDSTVETQENHYRLSHDFLVEPIREWVDRETGSSVRGRISNALTSMSDAWHRRPNKSLLPGYGQFLYLSALSPLVPKTDQQREFLRAARRHHTGRISATGLAILAFIGMSIVAWNQRSQAIRAKQDAKAAQASTIASKIDLLLHGQASETKKHIEDLAEYGEQADAAIEPWTNSSDASTRSRAKLFRAARLDTYASLHDGVELAPSEFFETFLGVALKKSDAESVLVEGAKSQSMVHRVRSAILLAYLGDMNPAAKMLAGSPDADADIGFLLEFARWRGSPKPWIDLFESSRNEEVRFHVAICLASYTRKELKAAGAKFNYRPLQESSKAHMSQIAIYLAEHLGDAIKPLPPAPNANWKVTQSEIPMVKIDAGRYPYLPYKNEDAGPDIAVVPRNIWFSMRAVPNGLYHEFIDDEFPLLDGSEKKTLNANKFQVNDPNYDDEPVTLIDALHANSFCNWLSEKEGLEPVYTYDADLAMQKTPDGGFRYPFILNANNSGYRLPTWGEFNVALRAKYFKGVPWQHAITIGEAGGRYTVAEGGIRHVQPFRALAPNRNGIFINDPYCGSWLTGNENFTRTSAGAYAAKYGPYDPNGRNRFGAYESIFVVQHRPNAQAPNQN